MRVSLRPSFICAYSHGGTSHVLYNLGRSRQPTQLCSLSTRLELTSITSGNLVPGGPTSTTNVARSHSSSAFAGYEGIGTYPTLLLLVCKSSETSARPLNRCAIMFMRVSLYFIMREIDPTLQAQNVAAFNWERMKKADETVAMQHKNTPSLAGQFLKSYREKHHLTQEQLAEDLRVEPRTLRAWENGERQLNNINELYRISDLLGVEPEQLGLANSLVIPKTPEQIEEIIHHTWTLVDESRLREARTIIERLVQSIRSQITTENPVLLRSLAHSYHSAGYIISEATQAHESYEAILYYQQMETIARILKDNTLLILHSPIREICIEDLGISRKP